VIGVTYTPPIADYRFLLGRVLGYDQQVATLAGYEAYTLDTLIDIVSELGSMIQRVVAPTNSDGDQQGCRLADGVVTVPASFHHAYRTLTDAGWTTLTSDPAYGGMGLPHTARAIHDEMLCAANLALSTYITLGHGVQQVLAAYGSDEQKARYLPPLADGSWCGTMCLTEPHCGTDLGLLRSRAVADGAGGYRISGTKIFITNGEHDLVDNIVHLVLAKLPDAPAGTRGISTFIVPKRRPDGTPNAVTCTALEHKMGIHGSPTCVLEFADAWGELVGEPHTGMRSMFVMMNGARLNVGIQGLALADAAYQQAARYAHTRAQGRAPAGAAQPDEPADPIIVHPDVRRALLLCRATTEAGRALALWTAILIDVADRHADPAEREAASDLVALLTPIVKAALTDHGFAATNLALGVFGGAGYIRETGVEQLVRDARITQIYEGTNGVQALDLTARKILINNGRLPRRFFDRADAFVADPTTRGGERVDTAPLAAALTRLRRVTAWLTSAGADDRELLAASATDYLQLFALTVFAYLWVRMADAADDTNPEKRVLARFYLNRVLPQTETLATIIEHGKQPLMQLPADAF
jgi:alkylation response protein AidB-like acyl-CoA dehydrogenase